MSIDIANLRKLLAGAPSLPWHMHEGDLVTADHKDVYWAEDDCPANDLIVAAVNSLPELLDEVERLREHSEDAISYIKTLENKERGLEERIAQLEAALRETRNKAIARAMQIDEREGTLVDIVHICDHGLGDRVALEGKKEKA